MSLWLVAVAFAFGFAAKAARLPPLVGYLLAGFVLHAVGIEATQSIELISDVGILLLLFGIGLKMELRTLARPAVWAGATVHSISSSLLVGGALILAGAVGIPLASSLSVAEAFLVGFAFSFSSTVFAVKALEDRNETSSLQGRIAVGTLVVQDIFAVLFLTFAVEEKPSLWAIPVLIAVVLAGPIYGWVLDRVGHGELLLLLGLALAVGVGAEGFDAVGLKPDLGALIVGLTLSRHPRSSELAETLLDLKDVLLIGFFLSIGLGGIPTWTELAVAAGILTLLPLKTLGFLALITAFGYRVRTAWHSSISLSTFSEFGLIVAVVGVERGFLESAWTTTIALAVAVSFALASPVNRSRYDLYSMFSKRLLRFERSIVQPDDALIDPQDAKVIVFGLGRVGEGAYDALVQRRGETVLGVDRNIETIDRNHQAGRNVVRGDALDPEFWERLCFTNTIELVVLAMSDHSANQVAVTRVREFLPRVRIAATASRVDEVANLTSSGVDVARNLYEEAGQGLADDACDLLDQTKPA